MATEAPAYPKHFQKLSANSSEEDAKVAYDNWAETYEKVDTALLWVKTLW